MAKSQGRGRLNEQKYPMTLRFLGLELCKGWISIIFSSLFRATCIGGANVEFTKTDYFITLIIRLIMITSHIRHRHTVPAHKVGTKVEVCGWSGMTCFVAEESCS